MAADSIKPVLVLLPVCVEWNEDVFLSILKNLVARTKFEDNYLSGFKAGMTSAQIDIGSDDISANWTMLNSRAQRVWQSKLIGFWCSYNYPLIGRKLFGEVWEATLRKSIMSNGIVINADEVDTIVFQKMRLRLVELSVNASTSDRLKWFVKAPSSINVFNPVKLSKKMRAFSIRDEHLNVCWKALKLGEFSTTAASMAFSLAESRSLTGDNEIDRDDLAVDNGEASMTFSLSESRSLTGDNEIDCDDLAVEHNPPKRTRVDYVVPDDSSAGSYEMMSEIRDNVRNLTDWFDSSHIDTMHKFKMKEVEVAKANISLFEMTEKNTVLKTELQEARQAWNNEKKNWERARDEMIDIIRKLEADTTINKKEVETLVAEKRSFEEADVLKVERVAKLEADVSKWTVYATSKEKEVEVLLAEKKKSEEMERKQVEMMELIAKLEASVSSWTVYAASKEREVEALVAEKKIFEETEVLKAGMSQRIAQLDVDLNAWTAYAVSKEKEVELLVVEKKKIEEATRKETERISKLEVGMSEWSVYATSKEQEVMNAAC